jgi:hypothetical protein
MRRDLEALEAYGANTLMHRMWVFYEAAKLSVERARECRREYFYGDYRTEYYAYMNSAAYLRRRYVELRDRILNGESPFTMPEDDPKEA